MTTTGRIKREPHAARTRRGASGSVVKFRQEVQARADGWCQGKTPACPRGLHHGVHAHHVLSRARGGSHNPANGVWLCWAAHEFVHDHPLWSSALGLLAPSAKVRAREDPIEE